MFDSMFDSMFGQLATVHPLLPALVGNAVLLLSAVVAYLITKGVLLFVVRSFAKRTQAQWDDALVKQNVFGRLAQIVPALVIQQGIHLVPDWPETAELVLQNVISAYMITMITLTLTAILAAANQIYEARPEARNRPIKGFVQLGQLAIIVVGLILVIAALIDKSPVILLSGLGAITAVLLIVFKDTW